MKIDVTETIIIKLNEFSSALLFTKANANF